MEVNLCRKGIMLTNWRWSAAPFPILTGLDPLWPSKCVNSISSRSLPPWIVYLMEKQKKWAYIQQSTKTLSSGHYLQRSIWIFVLQPLENELHIGCRANEFIKLRTSRTILRTIGFVCVAEPYEGIQGKWRISDPRSPEIGPEIENKWNS